MADERKKIVIRLMVLIPGAIFIISFTMIIIFLLGLNYFHENGLFMLLTATMPFSFPVTLLGSIYCVILFINPRKLPVFDDNADAGEPVVK